MGPAEGHRGNWGWYSWVWGSTGFVLSSEEKTEGRYYCCLQLPRGGCRWDEAKHFSEMHTERMRSSRPKLKLRKFWSETRKKKKNWAWNFHWDGGSKRWWDLQPWRYLDLKWMNLRATPFNFQVSLHYCCNWLCSKYIVKIEISQLLNLDRSSPAVAKITPNCLTQDLPYQFQFSEIAPDSHNCRIRPRPSHLQKNI